MKYFHFHPNPIKGFNCEYVSVYTCVCGVYILRSDIFKFALPKDYTGSEVEKS